MGSGGPGGSAFSAADRVALSALSGSELADFELVVAELTQSPGKRALAVFNVNGEVFVTDDRCTHGMAPLSDGFLEGDVIECPWHGGAFNVRTGAPAGAPCTDPIRTYRATIEDGVIVVDYR